MKYPAHSSVIRYHLPAQEKVILKVFDLLGKDVEVLVNDVRAAGVYEVEFTNNGNYPSGIYFYTIQAESFTQTRKFVLMK